MKYEIVDSHVHLGTTGVPWVRQNPEKSIARWAARATEAGIHRAVLMAAPVKSYAVANNTVAEIAARAPEQWLWYVFINPVTDRGRIAEIVAAAHSRGACGSRCTGPTA